MWEELMRRVLSIFCFIYRFLLMYSHRIWRLHRGAVSRNRYLRRTGLFAGRGCLVGNQQGNWKILEQITDRDERITAANPALGSLRREDIAPAVRSCWRQL